MKPLRVLLAVLDLGALAAFMWVFFTPSESGQGVFLWLSLGRLVLSVFVLLLLMGLLAATFRLWRSKQLAEAFLGQLDTWLLDRRQLFPVRVALVAALAVITVATAAVVLTPLEFTAYQSLAPDSFPLLRSLTYALLPVLMLVALACSQAAVFLRIRYPGRLKSREAYDWIYVGPSVVLLLIALLTAFHWITLAFRLRFFTRLPAWYWIFEPVPFGLGDVWFILGALILLVVAHWALIVKHRLVMGLLLAIALGWFLQFGVGLMGGKGLETLRDRYFTTYHQAYVAAAAAGNSSILDNIRHYDQLYGSNTFTTTKPPGLMALYIGLDHMVNGFPSRYSIADRYARLSTTIMWLFPLLAASTAALVWAFARRFAQDPSGLVVRVAPLLYVLAPNLILFSFFADQALYPAMFLLGAWFAVCVIRRDSMLWAALLGAVLYIGAFLSFSMLLLYVFAGLFLLLSCWKEHSGSRWRRLVLTSLGIAAGTLAMYWLGATWLKYDFLSHFQRMASINHNFDFYLRVGESPPAGVEPLAVRLGQIGRAAWLNNLDFAAAVGFPIYVLFAVQATRRILSLRSPGLPHVDLVLLALVLSFVVLNLAGTAQGEVPRLWLFWLPMVALLAANELQPHLLKRSWLLLALGAAQIATVMLTFHFQDLRM